jgi:hypothetical protein
MSKKSRKLVPSALVGLAVLFAAVIVATVSYAGDAVTLKPVEDKDVPQGSQIPEWRTQETQEKVREYKERMRAESSVQQQGQVPQNEPHEPQVEQP